MILTPVVVSRVCQLKQFGLQAQSSVAALNRMIDMQPATLAVSGVFWVFGLISDIAMVVIWFAKPPFASGGPGG